MIKLKDILNESIRTYEIPDQIFEDILKFGANKPVLYRGMDIGGTNKSIWAKIENNRMDFRGQSNKGLQLVLPKLGVERPVFVTRSSKYTTIFGSTGIIVPIGKWELWTSSMISDLGAQNSRIKLDYMDKNIPEKDRQRGVMSTGLNVQQEKEMIDKWWEDNLDDVLKSYKKITTIPSENETKEMILDVDSYWFIDTYRLYREGGKYMPKDEVKTYKDLIYKIRAFNKYQNFLKTRK